MAKKKGGKKPKMGTPNIVMSDELWSELQEQAAKEEISASAIIRRLVRGYLVEVKRKEMKTKR
jgi:metal-responsive CopG/Arc/MetJ family transcriptional regulator